MIALISCMAQNRVIGREGDMPWHLPADLKFFKRTTLGHPIVMGRKTFESVGSRPLPKRENIILTRDQSFAATGCTILHSLHEVLQRAKDEDILFIIGGAELYKQFIPYADLIYLTVIEEAIEGDTFFPVLDLEEWEISERVQGDPNVDNPNGYSFTFYTYSRKK